MKLTARTVNPSTAVLGRSGPIRPRFPVGAEPMPDGGEGYVIYHRESERIDEEPDKKVSFASGVQRGVLGHYLDGLQQWTEVGLIDLNT